MTNEEKERAAIMSTQSSEEKLVEAVLWKIESVIPGLLSRADLAHLDTVSRQIVAAVRNHDQTRGEWKASAYARSAIGHARSVAKSKMDGKRVNEDEWYNIYAGLEAVEDELFPVTPPQQPTGSDDEREGV